MRLLLILSLLLPAPLAGAEAARAQTLPQEAPSAALDATPDDPAPATLTVTLPITLAADDLSATATIADTPVPNTPPEEATAAAPTTSTQAMAVLTETATLSPTVPVSATTSLLPTEAATAHPPATPATTADLTSTLAI
nr:hypothetical protein [Caldilineaceae bacterium]